MWVFLLLILNKILFDVLFGNQTKTPNRLLKSLRWRQYMEITQKLLSVAFEKFSIERQK